MKKLAKYTAWFIAVLASLLLILAISAVGVGYWAFKNPREAFGFAERHILPADLKISWDTIAFESEHLGGLDFLFDIRMTKLHVVKTPTDIFKAGFDIPIDAARVRASVFPLKRSAIVHRAEAFAKDAIRYRAGVDVIPAPDKNPVQRIEDIIHLLKTIHSRFPIETFDAHASKVVIEPVEGEPFTLAANLQQPEGKPLAVAASFALPGASKTNFDVKGEIRFDAIGTRAGFLDALILFKGFNVDAKVDLTLSSAGETTLLKASGPVSFRKEKLNLAFTPQLDGEFRANESKLTLRTDVTGIPGPLVKIERAKLELTTPLEEGVTWSGKPSTFSLTVPIELFFVSKAQRPAMEKACACKLPEIVVASASGKVWLQALTNKSKTIQPALESKISVESVKNEIFTVDLAGELKVNRGPEGFKYSPSLDCAIAVQSFRRLKPLLDIKGVLIPAPFDVLDGTMSFNARGPVSEAVEGLQFPVALNVDLASATQKVKLDTSASVLVDAKFTQAHLDVKAKIESLYLDLPPLDPLGGLPRVARDARFMKVPANSKTGPAKFKMSFNFEVETGPGAVRLKSKYFRPFLPLQLKVQSSGAKENTGFIASEPFDVTYLRRTVRVENLRIDLDGSDKGVFPLRGRLSVRQTEYTIFIDVVGTTKSPFVTLSSEPYLPKDEIVSVLLFDRRSDQLVSGDAETAGGVQAAIADRAIGLFGLWAFATTPIKSFSYNPVTKVYTATVAISDDLTAGVGTDWETAARLELRKRISRRWSLTAAWTPATQEENANSKLVLQWEKRF